MSSDGISMDKPASDKQLGTINFLARQAGIDPVEFVKVRSFDLQTLTVSQASQVISDLNDALNRPTGAATPVRAPANPAREPTNVNKPMRPSESPRLMARLNGIPEELADAFFSLIDGALYTRLPGLLYLASRIGYSRIAVESQPDTNIKGGWIATARIYPKIPVEIIKSLGTMSLDMASRLLNEYYGYTEGVGNAGPNNLKQQQMPYVREMAEARALRQALRRYAGYGGASYEEISGDAKKIDVM